MGKLYLLEQDSGRITPHISASGEFLKKIEDSLGILPPSSC
jgi:hypothetical protein